MIAIEEAAPAAKIAKKLEGLNEGHLESTESEDISNFKASLDPGKVDL